MGVEEVIELISEVRGVQIPDTQEQADWLYSF
jgi:hypothetical protein